MEIGRFTIASNGHFMGSIATLTVDLPRLALKETNSTNERAPTYEIFAPNVNKRWVKVGALWEVSANSTGELYLQGHIEDPSLAERLYIACFKSPEDGSYGIAWNRNDPTKSGGFGSAKKTKTEKTRSVFDTDDQPDEAKKDEEIPF